MKKDNPWTLEKVKKLKEFVEHRDYVVKVVWSDEPVTQLELNPDPEKWQSLGDIALGGGEGWEDQECNNPIEDHSPEDFKVYKLVENWLNENPS